LALQGLCCLDVQGPDALDLIEAFIADSKESPQAQAAAGELMRGCLARRDECDAMLARHARHWDLSRLAMVDRNALRLAAHELLSGRTPYKVVISEALRLAREFSTADSPRFVNGVLDAVARELRRDAGDAADNNRATQNNRGKEKQREKEADDGTCTREDG